MLVRDIANRDVVTVDADATVRVAAEKMVERNVGSLVILNDDGTPTGMLTDRDIVTRVVACGLDPASTQVSAIMGHPVVSVRETANIETALGCMTFGVRRIPVVNSDEQLVGIVSLDDFLLMYSDEFDQVRRLLRKELAR